ncbi:unnamed protein product [Cuscuta epithymum]|uniref:Uncharacterized protein n=1 Tax=Cuscuta epithymum TaxID=186058 RepID=A0AAV0F1R0_9ASTE|nr:unnamed protein product [Cuscuta epithymum]
MAEIPVSPPLQNPTINAHLHPGAVHVPGTHKPTEADVVNDTKRVENMKKYWDCQALVTQGEMAEAISHQQRIISKYVAEDTAPAWAAQMTAQMNEMNDTLTRSAIRLNAESYAARARSFNSKIPSTTVHGRNCQLRGIPKCNEGHPPQIPGAGGFPFNQPNYPVGSFPPFNLMPRTLADIDDITDEMMASIFWFYNDPHLIWTNDRRARKALLNDFLLI